MDNRNIDRNRNNPYNKIPVYYCNNCLSLLVINGGEFIESYCDDCASTDIVKGTLDEYDELYKQRFGKKFFNLK